MYGISLFGNIGIAELGFKNTKIEIVAYSELEAKRARFYNHVFPRVEQFIGDINNKMNDIVNFCENFNGDINFILATPPCQGSSIAGKREKGDTRNQLITSVVEALLRINPKYALIENVPIYFNDEILVDGINISIQNYLLESLCHAYNISFNKVDAADYGIPQHRKRTFVLLSRIDVEEWKFPKKHRRQRTVRQAIGHLESLVPACHDDPEFTTPYLGSGLHETKSFARRHILAMQNTPEGKTAFDNQEFYPKRRDGVRISGFRTTYKRMSWDKPAPTITMANNSISSQNNVHPGNRMGNGLWDNPRTLTLKEILILMTIPLNWRIPEWISDNQVRQYIGEGVPPRLIKQIIKNIPEGEVL